MNDTHSEQSGQSAGTLLRTRVVAPAPNIEPASRRAPARPASTPLLEETKTKAGLREGSQQDPRFLPASARRSHVHVSLEEVKEKWKEVLKKAQEENHSLPFLLSTSEPTAVEGDTVQVGVQYPFHRDKLNEPKCRLVLEKVLGEVCSAPMKVLGVVREVPRKTVDSVAEVLGTLGGRVVE